MPCGRGDLADQLAGLAGDDGIDRRLVLQRRDLQLGRSCFGRGVGVARDRRGSEYQTVSKPSALNFTL